MGLNHLLSSASGMSVLRFADGQECPSYNKQVGRTFLSVQNPAKRPVFSASELSKSTELALNQPLSSASAMSKLRFADGQECPSCNKQVGRTFLSVQNPAKRPVFAPSELSKSTEMGLNHLLSSASEMSVRRFADGQECPSYGSVTDRNVRRTGLGGIRSGRDGMNQC
jgi:hypothetical protein